MIRLLTLALVVLTTAAHAANTRGDAEYAFSGGGVIDVTTFNVTAGDSLVCVIVGDTVTDDISSVVWDSAGDNQSFTQVGSDQKNNIHTNWVYVLASATSTKSGTIRATQAVGHGGVMHCSAWSGTNTSSPVGQTCQPAETTSTTPQCTLTGVLADSSIIALVSNNNSFGAGGYSAGTNFTFVPNTGTPGNDEFSNANSYNGTEYWTNTGSAGNKTAAFCATPCGNSPWILTAFELKTAAGGGVKVNPISGRGGAAAAPVALGN